MHRWTIYKLFSPSVSGDAFPKRQRRCSSQTRNSKGIPRPINSIAPQRNPQSLALSAAEVHLTRKARCNSNFRRQHLIPCHEAPAPIETDIQIVDCGTVAHKTQEKWIELPLRDPPTISGDLQVKPPLSHSFLLSNLSRAL